MVDDPDVPTEAPGESAAPDVPGGRQPADGGRPEASGRLDRARLTASRTLERTVETAEAARQRSRLVDVVWTTSERDHRTVGSVLAGAVAFRLFVYLLPLFLAVLTLIGIVVGLDDQVPERVGEGVGLSGYVIRSVAMASEDAHRSLWFLVPLALWAVYSAGGATARVLHAVHTIAWDLRPTRMRRAAAAAGVTFLAALGGLASVGLMQWVRHESPGLGILAAIVSILPFAALWLGASLLLPHDPRAPWTALVPGALLVGVGFWLAHLFSVYVLAHRVDKASNLYGSLGVAAALLAWLYLFGRIMVAAAMLNATLWERRRARSGSEGSPGPADPLRPG